MSAQTLADLSVLMLALLTGFAVISRVPATLHTPLMSGTNAIHGVVVAGALLMAVTADDLTGYLLTFVAAGFAAMNVVGGYLVTDRMLAMFRAPPHRTSPADRAALDGAGGARAGDGTGGAR